MKEKYWLVEKFFLIKEKAFSVENALDEGKISTSAKSR